LEFTDREVVAGKKYKYIVTAQNIGGESDPIVVSQLIKGC